MKWTALIMALALATVLGGCEGEISAPGLHFKNFSDTKGSGQWQLAPSGSAINAEVSFDAFKRAAGSPNLQCTCRTVPIYITLGDELWRATAGAGTRPAGSYQGLSVTAINSRDGEPVRGVFLELPTPMNSYIFCANASGILPLEEQIGSRSLCLLNERIGPWHVSTQMGTDQLVNWKSWSEALQGAVLSRVTD